MARTRRRKRPQGWLPKQHGAWFMLSLPVITGVILRGRDAALAWYLLPLAACWVVGYLAFNAATVWLRSAPARRHAQTPPVLVYASISLVFGLLAVAFAGLPLLTWVVPFVPLILPALWLAARRKDRTLLSGKLTTTAASLMVPVVRFDTPAALLDVWATPPAAHALLAVLVVFGYLFGTVFHVKGMIRERGKPAWFYASVGWHAAMTLVTALLAATGPLSAIWTLFFTLTTARAWILPWIAGRRTIRPIVIGVTEIVLTALFVVFFAAS